jgi:hypothetical protein
MTPIDKRLKASVVCGDEHVRLSKYGWSANQVKKKTVENKVKAKPKIKNKKYAYLTSLG